MAFDLGTVVQSLFQNNQQPNISVPLGAPAQAPPQPNPQILANNATYADMLRKWYAKRPVFGSPDYAQQYQGWQSSRPTGKDLYTPTTRANALQGNTL